MAPEVPALVELQRAEEAILANRHEKAADLLYDYEPQTTSVCDLRRAGRRIGEASQRLCPHLRWLAAHRGRPVGAMG
jgi:hypothetical protein